MERQPAGREIIQRAGFERKARAAVLHQHAGRRQHAAGAEFPIERLDVGDDEARRVGGAHPDRIAGAGGERPGRGFVAVDLHRLAGDEAVVETRARANGADKFGSVTTRSRMRKRALGRLDQAVDVIEAFRLP